MTHGEMWEPKFDWYQATVQDRADRVFEKLRREYSDCIGRPAKPKNGAADAFQLVLGGLVTVTGMWGGGLEGYGVNVFSSGIDAPKLAAVVRRLWPEHKVSRADVALDYDALGAWDYCVRKALEVADEHGVRVDQQGDWHRGEGGRTLYLGARTSVVQVVIYEKGKQLPEVGRPNWVRVELRVYPKGVGKAAMAQASPGQMWGASGWSKVIGEHFLSSDLARLQVGTRWTKSDHERAVAAFIRQYRGVLGIMCEEFGGWAAVGEEIGFRVLEMEERQKELKNLRMGNFSSADKTNRGGQGVDQRETEPDRVKG